MSKHEIVRAFFITLLVTLATLAFYVHISFWYFVMVGLIWFTATGLGSAFIFTNYHVKAYCGDPSEREKIIALTFDDGPNENTLNVLDTLRRYGAKATFFCIGKNVEKHPDILRQVLVDGHVVGNHTYSHSSYIDLSNKKEFIEQLTKTDGLIENISGKKPHLFRPPYGVTTPSMRKALTITKHKVIGWNIRSLDGVVKDEAAIFTRIEKRIRPGGIILLHDTSVHTANMLEQLLIFLERNNYKVVSLERLLKI